MSTETLTVLRDLGAIGIIALAVLVLTITLYRIVKSTGDKDMQDNGILKQMIDLATSYKTESAEARDAYRQEAAATRAVVQENNESQRALIEATNVQTGEIRLLRTDFKSYQTLNTDTITGFRDDLDSFKQEVIEHLERLMTISQENTERHQHNKALIEQLINIVKTSKETDVQPAAPIDVCPAPASEPKADGEAA